MTGEVPLYKQSYGYSCGPASLLMVIGSLDRGIILREPLEMEVWADANLGESKATSAYGLALAALKRGFGARVWSETDGIGFEKRLKEHFPAIDIKRMVSLYKAKKEQARELGVEESRERVDLDIIEKELQAGRHPIILVSSGMMGEWVQIPHWIVVTGMEKGRVTIQNPETARIETYRKKRFLKYLGFQGETRMVSVYAR
ncbi:MAG: peptidase C39 family protein [Thermoplasmatota archaeon]